MFKHVWLLREPLKCHWAVKYFAVRWLQVYGVEQVVEKSVKGIAADLDVIDNTVTKATKWLEDSGFLVKTKIVKGKGRPTYSYRWIMQTGWEGAAFLRAHHLDLIDYLLGPGRTKNTDDQYDLPRQNALLLTVLLANADKCGVVRGLSLSHLSDLTGMAKQAVSRRVRALATAGYIRWHCPGVRGYRLFGAAPSVYFVNLTHPIYMSKGKKGLVALFEWGAGEDEPVRIEGREIFLLAESIGKEKQGKARAWLIQNKLDIGRDYLLVDDSFVELHELFEPTTRGWRTGKPRHREHFAYYLQTKIEEYASYLLSERWAELTDSIDVYAPELIDRVKGDLTPPSQAGSTQTASPIVDDIHDRLAMFIYSTSQHLARRIKSWMEVLCQVDLASMDHCIMPTPLGIPRALSRSVISFWKESVTDRASVGVFRVKAWQIGLPQLALSPPDMEKIRVGSYTVRHSRWDFLVEPIENEGCLELRELTRSGLSMEPGSGVELH